MSLTFSTDWPADQVIALLAETFALSENAEEGEIIREVTKSLLATEPADHVVSCSAVDDRGLAGNIIFSRLFFEDDPRCVFLLGPVAVETSRQRQGIGQALLRWGLAEIARRGADIAVTYGDPAYYPKVGFQQVGADIVPPPHDLKWPHGWMAQSLTDVPLTPLKGPSACVPAFDKPDYW